MMTPYEKLKSLPNAAQYLKPRVSFQDLDALATSISDNDAAQRLNPENPPRSDSYLDWKLLSPPF
jgi:hypothetical protein